MAPSAVVVFCVVLGLVSHQVSAQWPNGGQSGQGQGGFGQQGMGMGQGAGMGLPQGGQNPGARFGQMSGQGMGMSPAGGQGMGMSPAGGQGMGMSPAGGQGMGIPSMGGQGMGMPSMGGQGMGMPSMGGQGMGMPPMGGQGMGMPSMGGMGMSSMGAPGMGALPAMAFGRSLSPAMSLGRSQSGNWRNMLPQQDDSEFLTCIATTSNKDDMRVTFINQQASRSPWGMFNRMPGNSRQLRLEARITSGQGSQLQGLYQLVITQYSRTEDQCLSRALGDILTDQTPAWWGSRNRTPRGVIGSPLRIMRGHTATSSETIDNIQFDELAGLGMGLCPSNQISGTRCVDEIPMCCKIGYDTQRATTPFIQTNQMIAMGGSSSGSNSGLMGFNQGQGNQGLNQQMGGQGFDSGFGGQQFDGLNQPAQPSFNAGGSQNQGSLLFRK